VCWSGHERILYKTTHPRLTFWFLPLFPLTGPLVLVPRSRSTSHPGRFDGSNNSGSTSHWLVVGSWSFGAASIYHSLPSGVSPSPALHWAKQIDEGRRCHCPTGALRACGFVAKAPNAPSLRSNSKSRALIYTPANQSAWRAPLPASFSPCLVVRWSVPCVPRIADWTLFF
jgi:hypothetical protein